MPLKIYREELPHLTRLSLPVIVSQVGVMMMGMVDSFVVGRYSSVELAGVAAGNSIFWTLVMIGLGLLNGMDAIVSQAHGAQDQAQADRCLGASLQLSTWFSLLLMPGLLWLSLNLHLVGAAPDVADAATPYLFLLSFSLLPLMLASALQRYWQCLEVVMPFTFVIIFANVINLLVNLVLVDGSWGFPALGARGAAVATTCCRIFILIAAIWITIREWRRRGMSVTPWHKFVQLALHFDKAMTRQFLRLGLPAAGQMTLEVSAFSLTTLVLARLGTTTLAAHHIILSTASFAFMFPLGISAATATRVGYHIGRGDQNRAVASGWLGIAAGGAVMLISAGIFLLFPEALLRLFTEDEKVVSLGVSVIFLCGLFQIFDGVQVVSAGALRGVGDTRTAFFANMISHWFIGVPLGFTLCFHFAYGLKGLWIGLAVGLMLTALINTYFWQARPRRLRTRTA